MNEPIHSAMSVSPFTQRIGPMLFYVMVPAVDSLDPERIDSLLPLATPCIQVTFRVAALNVAGSLNDASCLRCFPVEFPATEEEGKTRGTGRVSP